MLLDKQGFSDYLILNINEGYIVKQMIFLLLCLLPVTVFAKPKSYNNIKAQGLYLGLETGMLNGFGGQLNLAVHRVSPYIPLGLSLGLGYYYQSDPGNGNDARDIFITASGDASIIESGRGTMISLDLSYQVKASPGLDFHFYGGPRYQYYQAAFRYLNNNEELFVKARTWGVGIGLQMHIHLSKKAFLQLGGGLDYYPPQHLEGHDTIYTPDGNDQVNPIDANTYEDADTAINQPGINPRVFLGISFRLN